MNSSEAQQVMEMLRKGIPPDGYVRYFTVGRKTEINCLISKLLKAHQSVLLLKANWGAGKTHLLRFIREMALQEGYAVSSVTLDANSAVRFNRMDQIFGAICRGIEVPNLPRKGLRPFFDLICKCIKNNKGNRQSFWNRLTNNSQWDYSDILSSYGLFVALRAWYFGEPAVQDLIEDWLYGPWNYYTQRKLLYNELVGKLRVKFRDPRMEWQFYADGVFIFNANGHYQSWAALRDLHTLACSAGLRGFIILFDEFEDVIHNIKNIKHQQSAFWNLFKFYSGKHFPGMTFYAVTLDFVNKCKKVLLSKQVWDYDFNRFDALETFEMSPLNEQELYDLAVKIMETHAIAFKWETDLFMEASELRTLVGKAASVQIQDRVRYTIREIVKALDRYLEGADVI